MVLLALVPALRTSGYAVLQKDGRSIRCLACGVIKNSPKLSVPQCLIEIHQTISDLIARHKPEVCALESVIYAQNMRTAITLGSARGSAILAAAQYGLTIFEYPPKRVKLAVVGRGGAQKAQVGFMVRALLGLSDNPSPDAADALAIGLTHFQMQDSPLQPIRPDRAL
jgi:crossover junction endodeoxyribonuclease RuvC